MTITEFLEKLAAIKDVYSWVLTPRHLMIRYYYSNESVTCPAAAVAGIQGCNWLEAADILNMSKDDIDRIVHAADNFCIGTHATEVGNLRTEMLNALGLKNAA